MTGSVLSLGLSADLSRGCVNGMAPGRALGSISALIGGGAKNQI